MSDDVYADAISVMKKGGQQIAEEAAHKWWNGTYPGCQDQQTAMIAHWKAVRDKVADLARELKEGIK